MVSAGRAVVARALVRQCKTTGATTSLRAQAATTVVLVVGGTLLQVKAVCGPEPLALVIPLVC